MPELPATTHWLLLPPTLLMAWMLAASFGGYAVLAADRGQPARFGSPQLALYVREASARALLWLMRPLGWGRGRPWGPPGPGSHPPVLLVCDHSHNRSSMRFLETFLAQRGWTWVWAINPVGVEASLRERAEALALAVSELRASSGATSIDIVAHGTGGLVAAWYLKHQEGTANVRHLVTLGTPWKGTRMAVFDRGALATETVLDAPLLDDLAPPPVPTTSVWSADDPVVIPSSSALPDGADSVHIESAGHTDMLVSARVFRAVAAALDPSPGTSL